MLVAALLLTGAAVPTAFAQRSDDHRTSVYVGDLDLETNKGSREALNRIEGAAADVCDPDRGPMLNSERETAAQCETETVLATVDSENNPGLSAQYEGRFPEVIIQEDPYYDPNYPPASK